MESNHNDIEKKQSKDERNQKPEIDKDSNVHNETGRSEDAIVQSSGKSPKTLPTDLLKNSPKGLEDGELAKLMALELLHRPETKKTNRFRMLNCLFLAMVFILLFSFFAIRWVTNFVNSGLISEIALTEVSISLSEEEESDLEEQLRRFDNAINSPDSSGRHRFEMILTSDQVNYLLYNEEKKNTNLRYSRIRIYPQGEKARILVSIPLGGKKYINAVMEGKPGIRNGEFDIMLDYFKIGKLNRSDSMREKLLNRLRREIVDVPATLGLPFAIDSLTIKDSKVFLSLDINRSRN
jgi:hypothetical protein